MRGLELIIKGNNRSAIRALQEVSKQSEKTGRQVQRDSRTASHSFDEMGRSAGRMRGAIGGLIGTVGLGGLAFGIKDVVQAGMEWQSQQAQLRGALQRTGQASKANLAALDAAASRVSTRGGFAASENIHALTMFVTASGSVTKAQRDMQVATDISRRTGKDYSTVIRALMMLENGRTTGLARLGIAIPKVTTAQDALRLAEMRYHEKVTPAMREAARAQDALSSKQQAFASLGQLYGGATGAYSRTTAGRISNLHNTLKLLQERIGAGLLPVVNKLADVGLKVATFFGGLPTPVKLAVLGFTALIPLLAAARWLFGVFGSGIRGLLSPFSSLRSTVSDTAGKAAGLGLSGVAEAADAAAAALARVAEAGGIGAIGSAGAGATAAGGAGAAQAAERAGGGRIGSIVRGAGRLVLPAYLGYLAFKALSPPDKYNPAPVTIPGSKHPFYRARGGIVPHFAGGGPVGSDTIPGWLTPGEGVVTTAGMRMLGPGGLAALNSGAGAGGPTILHHTTILKLQNGRELARAVTQEVLNRAARGPTSMVGGSLVTGAPGLAP